MVLSICDVFCYYVLLGVMSCSEMVHEVVQFCCCLASGIECGLFLESGSGLVYFSMSSGCDGCCVLSDL